MPRWIRMRDRKTRHEFDVIERNVKGLVEAGDAERVKDYPVHDGPNARPAKPHVSISEATRRRRASTTSEPAAEPAEETKE